MQFPKVFRRRGQQCTIHYADDGTCTTAINRQWTDGIYENEAAAMLSFDVPASNIQKLQAEANQSADPSKRFITCRSLEVAVQ